MLFEIFLRGRCPGGGFNMIRWSATRDKFGDTPQEQLEIYDNLDRIAPAETAPS